MGKQNIQLVQQGEAVYLLAVFRQPEEVSEDLKQRPDDLLPDTD